MLGNAPADKLFAKVKVARVTDSSKPARAFEEYEIRVDEKKLPSGVSLLEDALMAV